MMHQYNRRRSSSSQSQSRQKEQKPKQLLSSMMMMMFSMIQVVIILIVGGGDQTVSVSAFVPSSSSSSSSSSSNSNTGSMSTRRSSSSFLVSPSALHATKKMTLPTVPSIPNPFQQLPWNVEKSEKRTARKLKLERSKLHRELGIAEDATYEKIVEATEIMIERADGDIKRKILIEVTKDKILQIRLNERLAGLMSDIVTKDAKAQSGFEEVGNALETELAEERAKEQKEWNAPAWTKGLIVKPDQKQINGQIRLWGILSLMGLALPPFIQYSNRFTWLVCIAQLSFRGMPTDNLEGGGIAMRFGGGSGSKSHIKTAWLIGLSVSLLGAVLTYSLMPAWAKGLRMTPFIVYSMRNFIYGTACCYFQPYKNK